MGGSTHHFGLAEAVELARALDRLPPRLWIYGIEGKQFEQGSVPSPEVTQAIEKVAERIASQCRLFPNGHISLQPLP